MRTVDLATALDPAHRKKYDHKHLGDIVRAIVSSKNIVCMTGAGISTSAGIPDFRSKNGLYELAASSEYHLNTRNDASTSQLDSPSSQTQYEPAESSLNKRAKSSQQSTPASRAHSQSMSRSSSTSSSSSSTSSSCNQRKGKSNGSGADLFNASVFRSADSLSRFLQFISALHVCSSNASPTPTHRFLSTLAEKGKLRRVYTQNIDGLESRAGLADVNYTLTAAAPKPTSGKNANRYSGHVVHLHGRASSVRCTACSYTGPWTEDVHDSFSSGQLEACTECADRQSARMAAGRRGGTAGALRPNITLYGEDGGNEANLIADVHEADIKSKPDCLLVMGTSLKVHGFKLLVKDFAAEVQERGGLAVFINLEAPSSAWDSVFDCCITGTTDAFVHEVSTEWKKRRPQDFMSQPTLSKAVFASSKQVVLEPIKKASQSHRPVLQPVCPPAQTVETRGQKNAPEGRRKRQRTISLDMSASHFERSSSEESGDASSGPQTPCEDGESYREEDTSIVYETDDEDCVKVARSPASARTRPLLKAKQNRSALAMAKIPDVPRIIKHPQTPVRAIIASCKDVRKDIKTPSPKKADFKQIVQAFAAPPPKPSKKIRMSS